VTAQDTNLADLTKVCSPSFRNISKVGEFQWEQTEALWQLRLEDIGEVLNKFCRTFLIDQINIFFSFILGHHV
jgi:hypothetical protein